MSEQSGSTPGRDQLGSIAEEAARLMSALLDWAKDSNLAHAGHAISTLPIATGSDECAICPICQLLHVIKGQKPEVYDHLQSAGLSLMLAAKAAFDSLNTEDKTKPTSEKINISFGEREPTPDPHPEGPSE